MTTTGDEEAARLLAIDETGAELKTALLTTELEIKEESTAVDEGTAAS